MALAYQISTGALTARATVLSVKRLDILGVVMPNDRLGIGFVGSGFVAGFHLQALVSVRDADVGSQAKDRHVAILGSQAKGHR